MKRLEIDLKITTRSHLTIGSKETKFTDVADTLQLKRRNRKKQRICIPGTSLKGALRSSAIQIAHFITNEESYCVDVDTENLCKKCIICRLFGAMNQPSKIFCEDSFPILDQGIKTRILTRNSIERDTGKAKEGALFSMEKIPPKITFESKIIGRNFDEETNEEEELLLYAALKNMNFCTIGNGNGLIEVKIIKIHNYNKKSEIITQFLEQWGVI